jgi:hypothetical protein
MILIVGAAAASLVTTGISAGISFAQGLRERKLMREAQKESEVLLRESEGFLKKNQYKNLPIAKQDIALARANVDALNQATIEAAQSSNRGVGATAGAAMQTGADMNLKLLAQAEQRKIAKDKLVADEEAQTDEQLASLRINAAEGAQQAAADSFAMMNAYFGDAATSGLAALQTGLTSPDLFKGKKEDLDTTDLTKTSNKFTPLAERQSAARNFNAAKEAENFRFYDNPGLRTTNSALTESPQVAQQEVKDNTPPVKLTDADLYKDLKAYDSPAKIKKLQAELIQKGFPVGDAGIDGKVGDDTTKAYFNFRRRFE